MLYTWSALAAAAAVVAVELLVWRTGLFATRAFWLAYGIILFFQCLVDGWLTKLSAPIVLYDGERMTGWRVPWDVPVEDFLFGFALCGLSLLVWERSGPDRYRAATPRAATASLRQAGTRQRRENTS
jgi:lycopene cyclase domain-containing protein